MPLRLGFAVEKFLRTVILWKDRNRFLCAKDSRLLCQKSSLLRRRIRSFRNARKKITYTTPEADVVDDCMMDLQELCRKIGIRVLFVQNFKSAPIHGMYRWYKDVPVVQLHDRFEKRFAMWFTFFHELAYVLYHGKKGICLQNIGVTHNYPEKEDEANCFAQKCMTDAVF